MHGSGFACLVLDLHAQYSQIHLFFGIHTGESFHESILGTRHIDTRSQGAEVRIHGWVMVD